MTAAARVLLATEDATVLELFREAAAQEPAIQLEVTGDALEMLEIARQQRPHAIACAATLAGIEGLELCRQIRRDPQLRGTYLLLLTRPEDRDSIASGLQIGVEDFLTEPLEHCEIRSSFRAISRVTELLERMRRIERRSASAQEHFDQVVGLVVHMLDFALPGSAARGAAIADLARRIADRFQIPEHLVRDLEIAARLHEIGRVVSPDPELTRRDNSPVSDGPQYVISSTAVLRQVEWLRPAADIVLSISENWDGTGLPDRLYKGQIPLRSRILRILIDFLETMVRADRPQPQSVASELAEHTGTRYDPVVVVHFRTVIGDIPDQDWSATKKLIPVTELQAGMVLAEDLFTSSGVKLLRKGAGVSQAMLEAIQRRHHVDPILEGAWIEYVCD